MRSLQWYKRGAAYVAYKKAFLGGFMSRKTGVKTKKCLVFQFYRIDNV